MSLQNPSLNSTIKRLTAFGGAVWGDCYVMTPFTEEDIFAVFQFAKASGKKVVLRGAGRSYGDASVSQEQLAISLEKMNSVLSFDQTLGIIEVQGGMSLLELCRYVVGYGFWPPVVSGTSRTTIAGAVALNIHGKNQYFEGTFCEHCLEYKLLSSDGVLHTVTAQSDLGKALPGHLGLFGVLISVKIKLKKLSIPFVYRQKLPIRNWQQQIASMEACLSKASAVVSWVDGCTDGAGTLEVAYPPDSSSHSPNQELDISEIHKSNQETGSGLGQKPHRPLPIGPGPHSLAATLGPYALRLAIQKPLLPLTNALRRWADRTLGSQAKLCDLYRFNFQLDWLWDWDTAYKPGALVQFQAGVPRAESEAIFPALVNLCHRRGFPPTLLVLKRHRPGVGILDYLGDGHSLAIDINQVKGTGPAVAALYNELTEMILSVGGKIYLAKDFLLQEEQFQRMHPAQSISAFKEWRRKMDPELILTSSLAERLNL